MNKFPAGESLRLTGSDCFLRALDSETRSCNNASHLSQLCLNVGSPATLDPWRAYLSDVLGTTPLLRSPVTRSWGIGAPHYRLDRGVAWEEGERIRIRDGNFCASEEGRIQASSVDPGMQPINDCLDFRRGELFYVDVFPAGGRCWILFTWAHMLFDGTGAEMFIRRLQGGWKRWCSGHSLKGFFDPTSDDPLADVAREQPLLDRLKTSRNWGNFLDEQLPSDVGSPGGALSNRDQKLDWKRVLYSEPESQRIRTTVREHSGHLQPMIFYLAVSMRAHHAVLRHSGSDRTLVVPVAVDMRNHDSNPVYRTHTSFLWFYAQPDDLADFDSLIAHLHEQRKALIKGNVHKRTAIALETVRWYPTWMYRKMVRSAFNGQLASFFFSYTGPFLPDLDEFLGAPVRDGFHLPSVPVSPGSSLIWSTGGKRVHYTHIFQSDVFDAPNHDRLHNSIRRDLPVGKPDHRSGRI